jgi:DNA replicative helicase MCM subunit Mcm2 (Cdc46/Mcm family)
LSTTNNKGWRTINFDLPDELRRHGIYRIAKEGNGKTWMCSVRCSDKRTDPPKDTLTVFGIGSSWEKTLKNFDKQMADKLDSMTKEMVRFFIADNAPSLQFDTVLPPTEEEQNASDEAEEQVRAVSVEQAMRMDSGLVLIEGLVTTMNELYKLVKEERWICSNCNRMTTRTVRNILQQPSMKTPCEACNSRDFKDRYEYINTVELLIQPEEIPENPLDGLIVYVFDENTRGIIIGERIKIQGRIEHVQDPRSKKYHTVLLAQNVKYESRKKLQLTEQDIEECKKFVAQPDFKQKLVSTFAPNIIKESHKKLGLILCAIGAPENNRHRGRINGLMIGPPALAKAKLGQEIIKTRFNSRYVSGKNTTGGSLTAMILNENGKLSMHFGPAVLAKNAVCFVNEFDKLDPKQQEAALEVMEEGNVHMNKFAKLVKIPAPTTIIASANPRNNRWLDPNIIKSEEIPFSSLILNRFDIILVFRDINGEEADRAFADTKTEYDESHGEEEPDYSLICKLFEYARSINPRLTQSARAQLIEYYVKLRKHNDNYLFNTRTLESIFRITKAFARLHLSSVVDDSICDETIVFMNEMFQDFHCAIHVVENPWTVTFNATMKAIQNHKEKIELNEAVKMACDRNDLADIYIGHVFEQKNNIKLRSICTAILENPNIERVGEHPTVVRWKKTDVGDVDDVGDRQKDSAYQQNKKNNEESNEEKKSVKDTEISKETSPISPISPRIVGEEEINLEPVSGEGASITETTQADFNYGDFSCPKCERLFPTETNRQIHIESEHLRRLHEPYRSGSKWYCKNCKETGDKFHLQETTCKGTKKK